MSTGQKIRKLTIKVDELNNELKMLKLEHAKNKQESTNECKKENNRKCSDCINYKSKTNDICRRCMCKDRYELNSESEKENKTTKLDEARSAFPKIIYVDDRDGKELILKDDIYQQQVLYESAIQEIIQQKDEEIKEITTLNRCLESSNSDLRSEYNQLKREYREAIKNASFWKDEYKHKQQKPQIDDDIIEWLEDISSTIRDWNFDEKDEKKARRLLKQIKA